MRRLRNLAWNVVDAGGITSKSFKSFGTKFKNDFAKELIKKGCKITKFNKGHYYLSGFFRNDINNCFYFSILDVRHNGLTNMLYRTAINENDYTGGMNRYVDIENDMIDNMNLIN